MDGAELAYLGPELNVLEQMKRVKSHLGIFKYLLM